MHISRFFLLLLAMLAIPRFTQGEVHNCNGVYTNRPCNMLTPLPRNQQHNSSKAIEKSKKSLILHDLRTKTLKAKKDYGIQFDISKAEEVCDNVSSSLDTCRELVSKLDDKLEKRIVSYALVKKGSEPKSTPTGSTISNTQTNQVVVIQQQVQPTPTPLMIIDLGPIHPLDNPKSLKPPMPPKRIKAGRSTFSH